MVETPSSPPGLDALAALRERLQELYRYHGKPSYRELAKRTGKAVSHTTAHAVIRCQKPPRWGQLELIVEALTGDDRHVEEFRSLWLAADERTTRTAAAPLPEEPLRLYLPAGDPLIGHVGDVWGVAFHPDGHLLATASAVTT